MYRVRLASRAERGLKQIRQGDPRGHERIRTAIRSLAKDPFPRGVLKLTGLVPPAWRFRVGVYRVVYEILNEELLIVVVNIAPRGEIYR